MAVNSITSKDAFTDKSINKINTINLTVQRFHKIINVEIKALKNKTFYQKLSLRLKDKLSTIEKDLFSHFKKM